MFNWLLKGLELSPAQLREKEEKLLQEQKKKELKELIGSGELVNDSQLEALRFFKGKVLVGKEENEVIVFKYLRNYIKTIEGRNYWYGFQLIKGDDMRIGRTRIWGKETYRTMDGFIKTLQKHYECGLQVQALFDYVHPKEKNVDKNNVEGAVTNNV